MRERSVGDCALEPRLIYRFGCTLKPGTPQTSWDSRRYRGPSGGRAGRRRGQAAAHARQDKELVLEFEGFSRFLST